MHMQTLHGFSHILMDSSGNPVGAARHIEVLNEMEIGSIILFHWPKDWSPDLRPTEQYNRVPVAEASPAIIRFADREIVERALA